MLNHIVPQLPSVRSTCIKSKIANHPGNLNCSSIMKIVSLAIEHMEQVPRYHPADVQWIGLRENLNRKPL